MSLIETWSTIQPGSAGAKITPRRSGALYSLVSIHLCSFLYHHLACYFHVLCLLVSFLLVVVIANPALHLRAVPGIASIIRLSSYFFHPCWSILTCSFAYSTWASLVSESHRSALSSSCLAPSSIETSQPRLLNQIYSTAATMPNLDRISISNVSRPHPFCLLLDKTNGATGSCLPLV